jgi:hypothetical protein
MPLARQARAIAVQAIRAHAGEERRVAVPVLARGQRPFDRLREHVGSSTHRAARVLVVSTWHRCTSPQPR